MNSMQYNEYKMLREEAMEGLSVKESVRRFAITTTLTILALSGTGIWKNNVVIYIILMITTLLCMVKTLGIEERTKEIIAYRIVFLEDGDENIRWARAITNFEKNYRKKLYNVILSYIEQFDLFILALLCFFIYYIKFYVNREKLVAGLDVATVILFVLLVLALYLTFVRLHINNKITFEKKVLSWKSVKESFLQNEGVSITNQEKIDIDKSFMQSNVTKTTSPD